MTPIRVSFLVLSALLVMLIVSPVVAQSLTPAEVATLTVENDLSVRQADLRLESTYRVFLRQKASAGPSLSLRGALPQGNTYRMSLNTQDGDPSHNAGVELRYAQSLPAGAALSAQLSNSVAATGGTFTQDPAASVGYSLPVFVNGKLFEPALTGSQYRGTEFGFRKAEVDTIDSRNAAVIASLTLFNTVVRTRDSITILENEIALDRETLRQLTVSEEQGRTPISDVWEAEIALEAKEDQLFQLSQELQLQERALSGRLGLEDTLADVELSRQIPTISIDTDAVRAAILERSLAGPRIDVESAELSAAAAGQRFGANLGISLSVSPVHPTDFAGGTLGESLGELAGDGTSLSISAGLSFSMPLYGSGAKTHESARVAADIERARIAVEQARSSVEAEIEQALLSERLLRERVEYDRRRVELAQRRADEVAQLFEIQTVSSVDVTNAQLQVQRRRSDARNTETELMISRLKLLQRSGENLVEVLQRN